MAIWVCLFPLCLVISSISTFVVSYALAVAKNHTDAFVPYISDTATTPPECCIFGLMTFITALTIVGTMYAQYKFNKKKLTGTCDQILNKVAFAIGLLSCLGMCVVATFQVTVIGSVHRVGAVIFFLAGVIYISIQTCISRHTNGCCTAMFCIRLVVTVIAAIAFISMLACFPSVESSRLHWNGNEKDYRLHIASAVCEWVVAVFFVLHFGTYIYEFKDFTIRVTTNLENIYEQL